MSVDYIAPHWANAALVTIDLQVDFAEGGAGAIPGTTAVLPAVRRLAAGFRRAGLPIVHMIRLYVPGGADVDPPRRAFVAAGGQLVAPGTAGSALLPGVTGDSGPFALDAAELLAGRAQSVRTAEIVLFKPRWGAFYRTDLEERLREAGVDTVVVAGCNLPNCPRATVFEASERDFRTVLPVDAISQVTAERVTDLARIGVATLTVDEILAGLPS
ncbi:cysteine hydrolase [Actinoplanes sp. SE50]|uniref:cysteine hydrolase family protein n=1 Tax=unclassified Actinoplanes TaxID=2626549 RepID=UPI00023EBB91|nr:MULTISPECIES: isochorismatase family cysteine hydrolase [unclassified Actinoplanes]AEV84498.1 isochorismatase hydrolase [Actinoplanes sp. SE50/110]ATO82890.1 cysteine hydrolase [Actinoplanes sp. SE50]SLM00298.1 cysteine hydrolase [Actinoplanes sp. SE50/110]